jgi:L-alanine-DL-glutamate epimerase-like enolase superfamily enzyme
MPAAVSADGQREARRMSRVHLSIDIESWPLAEAFVIARGVKTEARVVVASLSDGSVTGRGECVPYQHYGETVEGVAESIRAAGAPADRAELARLLPAGAARNALDCALWDLEAKRSGKPAAALAGVGRLRPLETAFTLSLASPAEMAAKAASVPRHRLLKLKLGGAGDPERMQAVRQARPDARLVADANEAWTAGMLAPFLSAAADAGVELIEQPLPADDDEALLAAARIVPVCADESAHASSDVAKLVGRYDAVNIKLDKAGGLTEALAMARAAKLHGLKIMVGSMVATSLSMAPAFLVAQQADWVDLDGPLLLARDRPDGLAISEGIIAPPTAALWG